MNTQPLRVLECSLWIGDLDGTTTEADVRAMFAAAGEPIKQVRILRDRATGMCLGYGFISFDNDESASGCLMRCNGKPVPGTNGARRFKLNYSKQLAQNPHDEYSAFVGELSDELTDLDLFNAFKQRYASVRWAKVMADESGRPRGFGFVRFGDESDFQRACVDMNGFILGSRAIRVSPSTSRKGGTGTGTGTGPSAPRTASSGISSGATSYGAQSPNTFSSSVNVNAYADSYSQAPGAAYYGAPPTQFGAGYPSSQYGYQPVSSGPPYSAGYPSADAYAYYAAQYANAHLCGDSAAQPMAYPAAMAPGNVPPYSANTIVYANSGSAVPVPVSVAPFSHVGSSPPHSLAHSPGGQPLDASTVANAYGTPLGIEALLGFASANSNSAAQLDANALIDPDTVYRAALADPASSVAWLYQHGGAVLFERLQATHIDATDPVLQKRLDAELADYGTA